MKIYIYKLRHVVQTIAYCEWYKIRSKISSLSSIFSIQLREFEQIDAIIISFMSSAIYAPIIDFSIIEPKQAVNLNVSMRWFQRSVVPFIERQKFTSFSFIRT